MADKITDPLILRASASQRLEREMRSRISRFITYHHSFRFLYRFLPISLRVAWDSFKQ
jgi:hypothetical protein